MSLSESKFNLKVKLLLLQLISSKHKNAQMFLRSKQCSKKQTAYLLQGLVNLIIYLLALLNKGFLPSVLRILTDSSACLL